MGSSRSTDSVVRSPLWTTLSSKRAWKASQWIVPQGLSLLYKTLWALQYPSSLCNGLHRHLVADICTEQRGQLELQPKFWLCSCQLERERHREIQVCLLQFSFHPKITLDAHISGIMSHCTISHSHTFFNTEMYLTVQIKHITDDVGYVMCHLEFKKKNVIPLCPIFDKGLSGLILPAAFTSTNQLINSVSHQISVSPLLCGAT